MGHQVGTWVGRLDSKSKLRIAWRVIFGGDNGKSHEIVCTVSRKSKKREVFFDAELIHSGALGLLESVGGVAVDTTLFEHKWQIAGRAFAISERVFVRDAGFCEPPGCFESDDSLAVAAAREAARFELTVDGKLHCSLTDIDLMTPEEKIALEERLQRSLRLPEEVHCQTLSRRPSVNAVNKICVSKDSSDEGNASSTVKLSHSVEAAGSVFAPGSGMPRLCEEFHFGAGISPVSLDSLNKSAVQSIKGVQGLNAFAARIESTLGPGILGIHITLRNDDTGQWVEVETASNEAQARGVKHGDVLLSLNSRALPPKLDASELMSLLRANPRYMLSEVVACLWRPLQAESTFGNYVSTCCAGMSLLEFAQLDDAITKEMSTLAPFIVGFYIVINTHDCAEVQLGDVLIGLDWDPTPRYTAAQSLAITIGDWLSRDKLTVNLWRPKDTLSHIVHATTCERSMLVASPRTDAAAASTSQSSIWGTSSAAVTVTGSAVVTVTGNGCSHRSSTLSRHSSALQDGGGVQERLPSSREGDVNACETNSKLNRHAECASDSNSRDTEDEQDGRVVGIWSRTSAMASERNFAVFKKLLQSGATLGQIVAEMRAAGVPKDITQHMLDSLRTMVAERHTAGFHAKCRAVVSPTETPNPRAAMLAMISKGQRVQETLVPPTTEPVLERSGQIDKFDRVLARYRKMVKLGVPAASVRQRMRLDQVDAHAVAAFTNENELDEEDITTNSSPREGKKRAKLHWDAVALDAKALAVSVWAADALGDCDNYRETKELLGDGDLERLATLFSDAKYTKKLPVSRAPNHTSSLDTSLFNGRPVLNTRLFDQQRSQNVSITITPLIRSCDGSTDALACMIGRLEQSLSLEQLETLLAAMPTVEEKGVITAHMGHIQHASQSELHVLDDALRRDSRFVMQAGICKKPSQHLGMSESCEMTSGAADTNFVHQLLSDIVVEPDLARKEQVLQGSTEARLRIYGAFLAENLAPAERFAWAVTRVEDQLYKLRAHKSSPLSKQQSKLTRRLDALVLALSAKPASAALAEKADGYARAARLLMASKDLAKLFQHILAAGNAVNAGSAKGGASAVRLCSLLQAARTKGTDGKTTLLDGVVGLLLDRVQKKSSNESSESTKSHLGTCSLTMDASCAGLSNLTAAVSSQLTVLADVTPRIVSQDDLLKHDLLDFPEREGLVASLDAVRGADERAIVAEAGKLRTHLQTLSQEIQLALLEFGPDETEEEDLQKDKRGTIQCPATEQLSESCSRRTIRLPTTIGKHLLPYGSSRQRRYIERERLVQLERDAVLQYEALSRDHIASLARSAHELRTYFACDASEPLDSIFATLRDFLRAFCDSRDNQRRQRQATQREAIRRAARCAAVTHNKLKKRHDCQTQQPLYAEISARASISPHHVKASSGVGPRPPAHPPPASSVPHVESAVELS